MSLYPQSQPSLNARMIKILWRQQQELLKKSPDHVKPIINNEDPIDIQADIEGPEGTPYESGIFRVKLFIPSEFPQIAPKGIFLTKIFHPNVSEKGEICVNTLKRDWNPKQWSLYNLFEVIKCLLIVPFPQSSLNEEAGKMFMDNYDEYFKVAKMLTGIHAKKKIVQKIDNDDIQMKINNLSEKKDKLIMKEKKGENIINEIDIIEEKDNMNISFLNDNSNSNSFFTNNDNNIFNNFDNPNFLDNIAITRSKTIKFCDRPKFSFLSQQDSNITSKIFYNNINQFSRMNSISSISSVTNYSNITSDIKKVSTFKEKPKLGSLPLLHMNSQKIKNKNNPYGFFRCKTLNLTKNESKKNNKDEINKWLMRI